jgi:hypothetical protein
MSDLALIESQSGYVSRYLKDGTHGLCFELTRSKEQLQMFVQQNLNIKRVRCRPWNS